MKHLITSTFLSLLIAPSFIFAQPIQQQQDSVEAKLVKLTTSENTSDKNHLFFLCRESFPIEEKGTIYLYQNWQKGTLIDDEDHQFTVDLRYRLIDDEMQIRHINKTKALYPQNPLL